MTPHALVRLARLVRPPGPCGDLLRYKLKHIVGIAGRNRGRSTPDQSRTEAREASREARLPETTRHEFTASRQELPYPFTLPLVEPTLGIGQSKKVKEPDHRYSCRISFALQLVCRRTIMAHYR